MGSGRPAGPQVGGGCPRSAGPEPTCGPGRQPQTRPSAPPPPSLLVAPRLLLRGRRRRPARRVRARFPPPPRACGPAGPGAQGRPLEPSAARGQSGRGGPLTSRPGVLSASSLPRVRSAASAAAAAAASPTSPASRGAAAAPRPPPPASQLPTPPFASRHRPGAPGSAESVQQAAARPPQPPAHNPPRLRRGGRAAARPGVAPRLGQGLARPPRSRRPPSGDYPAWLPRASPCRPRKGRSPLGAALQLAPFSPPPLRPGCPKKRSVAFRLPGASRRERTPRPPRPTASRPPTPTKAPAPACPDSLGPSL